MITRSLIDSGYTRRFEPLTGGISTLATRSQPTGLSNTSSRDGFRTQGQVLRFSGEAVKSAGHSGLFISSEFGAAKEGGLGEVTEQISNALSDKTFGGQDLRIVVPYLKPLVEEDLKHPEQAFKPTGKTITVPGLNGEPESFEILEKPYLNTWVYAIKNEKYFSPLKNMYTYANPALERGIVAQATALYNRAAAAFAPELDETTKQPEGVTLRQFKGKADFIIVNDWPTASTLMDLPKTYNVAKVFILHNEFDKGLGLNELVENGIFQKPEDIPAIIKEDGYFSPLSQGIKLSHVIMADPNYIKSVVKRLANDGGVWVQHLMKKVEDKLFVATHHDPGENFNPIHNPFLEHAKNFTPLRFEPSREEVTTSRPTPIRGVTNYLRVHLINLLKGRALGLRKTIRAHRKANGTNELGFLDRWREKLANKFSEWVKDLQATIDKQFPIRTRRNTIGLAEFDRFKLENKLALQRKYHLNRDPHAVVFSWMSRFDPNQKGFFMVAHTLKQFMLDNPKTQVIIGGMMTEDPKKDALIRKFFRELGKDPALQGRVSLPGRISRDRAPLVVAGSTYMILPSLYEPFGLSQLEAMRMGAIPIVHGVDGLLSSVYDPNVPTPDAHPETKAFYADAKRPDPAYGQSGIMMEGIPDIKGYQRAMLKTLEHDYLDYVKHSAEDAKKAFIELFAFARVQHPKDTEGFFKFIIHELHDKRSHIHHILQSNPMLSFAEEMLSTIPLEDQSRVSALKGNPTGLWNHLMKRLDAAWGDKISPTLPEAVILENANHAFRKALDRAATLANDAPALRQVAVNGMNYINTVHKWSRIAGDYKEAIERGIAQRDLENRAETVNAA
jgi:glycogen synthase